MQRYTRIVVGYEEEGPSASAARQGVALARWGEGEVVLVHVGNHPGPVARMSEQLAGEGVPVSYEVTRGDVASALAAVGRAHDADLIVVGTHGRTGVRRLVLGSVAESLVHRTVASVLAVRGTPVVGGYERVVVGTDFSPCSLPAVSRALAVAHDTAVVQVAYWWSLPDAARDDDPVTDADRLRERAELAAEQGRALVAAHAGEPRLRFRAIEGHAVDGLPALAADEDADLVVVGSHGYGGLRRVILGSVAEAVIRHAPCAVLVAR